MACSTSAISQAGISARLSFRRSVSKCEKNVGRVQLALIQNQGLVLERSALLGLQPVFSSPLASKNSSLRNRASRLAIQASAERSYIMIKPDGVQRGLVGEVISRFEKKGFVLKGLKLYLCPKEVAEEHYKDLSEKPFFPKLVDYIISGPVVAMVWEGDGVVASARKLIGATNPLNAEPGTIRGDLAVDVGRNVIHGSDSIENGEREIGLWFKEGEIVEWDCTLLPWLRE